MNEAWNWYTNRVVQFQLYRNVINREVFFKDAEGSMHMRPLKIFSMQGVEHNIDYTGFSKKKFHFYSSVSSLNFADYPNPPTNKRDWKAYREQFNKDFLSLVDGYDFVLDIDHKDLLVAHEIALKVKKIFDEFLLPYYVVFSGQKGFHFRIDWADIKLALGIPPLEWVETSKLLAKGIAKEIGFKFGSDIDSIYDARRVIRVPYSVHPLTGCVALPLSDTQFEHFEPENFKLESVSRKVFIRNRGLLKRTPAKPALFSDFVSKFVK